MPQHVIVVKDTEENVIGAVGKRNASPFTSKAAAHTVKDAMTLEEGETATVMEIVGHEVSDEDLGV